MESLQKAAFAYLTYVWHEAYCRAEYCRAESRSSVKRDLRDCFVRCFYDIDSLDAHLQLHFSHLRQFINLRADLHLAWYKVNKQKSLRQFRRGARRARARDASDTGMLRSETPRGGGCGDESVASPRGGGSGGANSSNMSSRMEGIITSMEEIIGLMQNLTRLMENFLKVRLSFETTARDRGKKGLERLAVGRRKKAIWMETDNWPWWEYCHTERTHWCGTSVGNDRQGGERVGSWWRLARNEWLDGTWHCPKGGMPVTYEERVQALDEYEAPWVKAHGQKAMDDALEATEDAFQTELQNHATIQSKWIQSKWERSLKEKEKKEANRAGRCGGGSQQEKGKGNGKRSKGKSHW